ncbi:TerD family protein [Nocardia sp. NPDC024068]|uniref:TerD family protein n=1 Tax=Nocardia sp. NPDC024068 TaxID=3157197 RepID=UPI00340AC869
MELSKGAHTPIPTSLLAVVISWRSEHAVDAHALLLDADGSVRGDRDLVFYNAPRHISQAVTLDQDPAPGTARLSVSLPRTESEVERIVVSGSLEEATFAQVGELRVTVHAVDGPVAVYTVDDSESVSAMMFGEFYRRDDGWRFRAVGQGWATGMAGLITEFGIEVDDGSPRRDPPENARRARRVDATPVRQRPNGSAARAAAAETVDQETAVLAGSAATGSAHRGDPDHRNQPPTARGADSVARDPLEGLTARTVVAREPAADYAREPATHSAQEPATHSAREPATEYAREPATRSAREPAPHSAQEPATDTARRRADMHPGNAHYRLDESPRVAAPWDRFAGDRPTRHTPGTVSLRRVTGSQPARIPPPGSGRADWYRDPEDPTVLRWWDGEHWTAESRPSARPHPHDCDRCGARRRRRMLGGHHPCAACTAQIEEFLVHWHTRAARVLSGPGPRGADWEELWASLRYQRIDAAAARAALQPEALQYVERRVAFAFADGQISAEEFDEVEHAITELALSGPMIGELRARMARGRELSRLREGELPSIHTPDLHLDAEELVYLDIDATHIRELARGPKHTDGRLIVSTKKLRFVGPGAGVEIPWSRIVSVAAEHGTVVVAATSARGGALFAAPDPDYLAAALEGALRIAKRLVLAPGQRDSRSIPQEVKAQVWQRDGGRCVECGDSHYLEFDHIIPLSRGGATSAANLQILCRGCNRDKGANI